jgi:excisionase family DNA binding protein
MSKTLKPKEAAAALEVGVARIYRWMKSGELTYYRFSEKDFRIPVEAISQFKEQKLCEAQRSRTENQVHLNTSQSYPKPMGQQGPSRWTQPTWRKLDATAQGSEPLPMEPLLPRPARKKPQSSNL